jgi:hypothetical protein
MKNRGTMGGFLCTATLAAILGVAAQAAAQTDSGMPPAWIADSRTGCKIWDPAPEPGESVQWSGGCKDGFADGQGTMQWLEKGKPGDRYEGDYRRGKRNGYGVVTFGNGKKLQGEWRDDELVEAPSDEI